MSRHKVQITVVVTFEGHTSVESTTMAFDDEWAGRLPIGRIIGDEARIVGERAWYGAQLPTPAREGGRD